jgi:hypothetical protein
LKTSFFVLMIFFTLGMSACQQTSLPGQMPTPLSTYTPNPTYTPQATYAIQSTLTPIPTNTAVASPTLAASPTPTGVFQGNILLKEDFENGSLCFSKETISFFGGETQALAQVKDETFQIALNGQKNELYISPCRDIELYYFNVGVQAQLQAGPNVTGFGIIFLLLPNNSFSPQDHAAISFLVNKKGEYCIIRFDMWYPRNTGVSPLAGCWAKIPGTYQPEKPNSLRVVNGDASFSLYVNDVLTASVQHDSSNKYDDKTGLIGLGLFFQDQAAYASVLFDNLVISER